MHGVLLWLLSSTLSLKYGDSYCHVHGTSVYAKWETNIKQLKHNFREASQIYDRIVPRMFLGICMKLINFNNSNCKSNEGSAKMSAAGSEGIGPKETGPETYEGRFELSARVWDSASQWNLKHETWRPIRICMRSIRIYFGFRSSQVLVFNIFISGIAILASYDNLDPS